MAPRNPHKQAMDAEIDRLCRQHTDAEGKFDVDAVLTDFVDWLTLNPAALGAQAPKIARAAFDAYDRARRPQPEGGQHGLFQPECLIPIGPNERVWMEHATREHLILWGAVDDHEFAVSAAAHSRKSQYRAERIRQWPTGYDRLIDVERDIFHWHP